MAEQLAEWPDHDTAKVAELALEGALPVDVACQLALPLAVVMAAWPSESEEFPEGTCAGCGRPVSPGAKHCVLCANEHAVQVRERQQVLRAQGYTAEEAKTLARG